MMKPDKILSNRTCTTKRNNNSIREHANRHHGSSYASIICLKCNSVYLADLTSMTSKRQNDYTSENILEMSPNVCVMSYKPYHRLSMSSYLQSSFRLDGKWTMEARYRVRDDSLQIVNMANRYLAIAGL